MKLRADDISLFILLVTTFSMSKAEEKKRCNLAYRCPTEENLVWATDGKSCQVFLNTCFFRSENCDRLNNKEKQLIQIKRNKCKDLCSSAECSKEKSPVCGYYNDKSKTFANQCEMENYICKTGEIISLISLGPCEQSESQASNNTTLFSTG